MREVHKGCRTVFDRVLALEPTLDAAETSEVTVPAGADPNRYRMVGNVTGELFRSFISYSPKMASAPMEQKGNDRDA